MSVAMYCTFCGQKKNTRVYEKVTNESRQFCSYGCYAEYDKLKKAGVVSK